jgi:AcrR family transcriptional regulator
MSPRSEKDLAQLRDERRQLIIETALKLFAENTFRGTTIEQVAQVAGISKGLVYNYFKSKDELLMSIFQFYVDEVPTFFRTHQIIGNPKDVLKNSYEQLIHNFETEPEKWTLYYLLSFQFMLDQGVKMKFAGQKNASFQAIKELFKLVGVPNHEQEIYRFMALFQGAVLNFVYQHEFPIRQVLMQEIERYCSYTNVNED